MTDPNVVLVSVDSLRADHVAGDVAETPAMDRLSGEGTTFTRAFAQGPFTTFSMPSLFTSRYPSALEYVEFSDQTVGVFIDDEPTLPVALADAGYETAGFHSNPLLSNLFGFDRGFETFDARLPLSGTDWLPGRAKILADKLMRLARTHAYLPAESLNSRALDWLDGRDDDRPFFLWLHYMDVHGPYQAKAGNAYRNKFEGERLWRQALKRSETLEDEQRRRLADLYRTEVEYTDRCLGSLLDELDVRGLREDTLVVVTADHGEYLGEDGRFSHPHELRDELLHVPLIFDGPDVPAETDDRLVELVDVAPTILDAAGAEPAAPWAGRPLVNSAAPDGRVAISEADLVPAYHGSVRTSDYRYVRNDVADEERLFAVDGREGGGTDVAPDREDVLADLRERLQDHLAAAGRSAGPDRETTETDIDDAGVQDRLRDLGYLE